MIEQPAIAGGSLVSALVVARWLWAVESVATWARMVALVLVLTVAGAVAGVIDIARLQDLVGALTDAVAGIV